MPKVGNCAKKTGELEIKKCRFEVLVIPSGEIDRTPFSEISGKEDELASDVHICKNYLELFSPILRVPEFWVKWKSLQDSDTQGTQSQEQHSVDKQIITTRTNFCSN